ncbi:ABC transporter substrate-binding protein [Rapidithrix thailandica]|uniref:ABC transporter substrate-binding protein n=1 Tax=Rapidithrix thailandica TaxID=413964 RepID=A0AAW9S5W3_9BACT
MMRTFFLLSILLFTSLSSFSQSRVKQSVLDDLKNKYEYGKSLLKQQKYPQAQQVFQPLTIEKPGNSYQIYASYFYALAAFKSGEFTKAENTLQQILQQHPSWPHQEEVKFLLGAVRFKTGKPDLAIQTLNLVKGKGFQESIVNLKKQELQSFTVDQVHYLYKTFQKDQVIAKILLDKIYRLPSKGSYGEVFQELYYQFHSNGGPLDDLELKKSVYKDEYHVAVLMPFLNETTNPRSLARNNQFVYDTYEGIKLACQWLQKDSINIKLHAIDTKHDSQQTQKILEDTAMQYMDLIIGPLYANTFPLVSEFSKKHSKVMVNPFSSNSVFTNHNPNAFLSLPSLETQARKVSDFVFDTLNNHTAYIIFGGTDNEKLMAYTYMENFKAKGGTVQVYEQFDYTSNGFGNLIRDFRKIQNHSRDTAFTSHVFVSVTEPVAASNVISALQELQVKVPVFVPKEWFEFPQISYDQLEQSNVHIFFPEYKKYHSNTTKHFTNQYLEKVQVLPSNFAFSGFETMYYFGKMMKKHGTSFGQAIYFEAPEEGMIYTGFSYEGKNDNQVVPVFKFENGQLIMVNNPLQAQR